MIHKRKYKNFEEYERHQSSKLINEYDDIKAKTGRRMKRMQESLEPLIAELKGRNVKEVLCLAARFGEEVEVFVNNGFNAVGIDINPPKEAKRVLKGDFHDLRKHECNFDDNSIDLVYCNSFDHVYDLIKVRNEIKRVLKPTGFIIADFGKSVTGKPNHVNKKNWEALTWDSFDDVLKYFEPYSLIKKTSENGYATYLIKLI